MKVAVIVAAVLVSIVCLIILGRLGSDAYSAIRAESQQQQFESAFAYCKEGPIAKNSIAEAARMSSCMERKLAND